MIVKYNVFLIVYLCFILMECLFFCVVICFFTLLSLFVCGGFLSVDVKIVCVFYVLFGFVGMVSCVIMRLLLVVDFFIKYLMSMIVKNVR